MLSAGSLSKVAEEREALRSKLSFIWVQWSGNAYSQETYPSRETIALFLPLSPCLQDVAPTCEQSAAVIKQEWIGTTGNNLYNSGRPYSTTATKKTAGDAYLYTAQFMLRLIYTTMHVDFLGLAHTKSHQMSMIPGTKEFACVQEKSIMWVEPVIPFIWGQPEWKLNF